MAAIIVSSGVVSAGLELTGEMYVLNSGTAKNTTVNAGGRLYISSGGAATAIKENGGYVWVGSGANATFVSNTFSGASTGVGYYMTLHSGTTAVSTTVGSNGQLYIYDGGVANTVKAAGWRACVVVNKGGRASGVNIGSSAYIDVSGGACASNVSVGSYGRTYISSGGTVAQVTVGNFANVYISSGGSAHGVKEVGGYVGIDAGADVTFVANTFSGAVTRDGYYMTLHSGTTAVSATVGSAGRLYVLNGGVASGVSAAGYSAVIYLNSGGQADAVTLGSSGTLYVYGGARAGNVSVGSYGNAHIYSGGTVTGAAVSAGGVLTFSGGTGKNVVIRGGSLGISRGASVDNLDASGGIVTVSSGGSLKTATVHRGGSLFISSGAIVGMLDCRSGAVVSAMKGAVIQATIDGTTPVDRPIFNNITVVTGAPQYRIDVQDTSIARTYLLADEVSGFDGTISLYVDGAATGRDYLLSPVDTTDDILIFDGVSYSLVEDGAKLYFTQHSVFAPESFYYKNGKLTVRFSNEVDPGSIHQGDITVRDLNGANCTVTSCVVSNNEINITFTQKNDIDSYYLTLSPTLSDVFGYGLDADRDGRDGEAADDVFTHSFSLTKPSVQLRTTSDLSLRTKWGEQLSLKYEILPAEYLNPIDTRCALDIYLSADKVLDSADRLLEHMTFDGIAGAGTNANYSCTASTLPLGDFYIIAKADAADNPIIEGSDGSYSNIQVHSVRNDISGEIKLSDNLGKKRVNTLKVNYTNGGTGSILAPLVIVTAQMDGGKGVLSIDAADLKDFPLDYTAMDDPAVSVGFLATGKNGSSTLGDGVTNSRNVYLSLMSETGADGRTVISLGTSFVYSTDTTPLDWNDMLGAYAVSEDYRAVLAATLADSVGETWGDYVIMLNRVYDYLAANGIAATADQSDLMRLEILSVDGGFAPIGSLASSQDLTLGNNALTLSLSRKNAASVSSHYEDGIFGYGWSSNWDASLDIAEGGDVSITLPGWQGSYRFRANAEGNYESLSDGVSLVRQKSDYIFTDTAGLRYTYGADGRLLSVEGANAVGISLTWSGGKLAGLRHSDGTSIALQYNADGRISAATSSTGETVAYTYDADGNLISARNGAGLLLAGYAYTNADFLHNITEVTDRSGAKVAYSYDSYGRVAGYAVPGLDRAAAFEYGVGEVTVTIDGGQTASYNYDADGRLIRIADTLGNLTGYTYDSDGNPNGYSDENGNGGRYLYDAAGNCVSYTDALGNTVKYTYVNNHIRTMTDGRGNKVTFFYDDRWNVAAVKSSDGTVVSMTYDENGNCVTYTDENGSVSTFTYDGRGNVLTATANGKTVSYTYDADNNVTGFTDATGKTRSYSYNADGLLTGFTDAGGAHTGYAYDAGGNLLSITYANGSRENFTYDQFGNMLSWTNARGQTMSYTVDAKGQTSAAYVAGNTVNCTYDAQGQLSSAGDMSFAYDARGNLLSVTYSDGRKVLYAYDAFDRVIRQQDETGNGVCYSYDEFGDLDRMTTQTGDLIADYDFDDRGRLIRRTNGNGTAETYSYTKSGQVGEISYLDAAGVTTGFCRYAYDADGNCTVKQTEKGSWSYAYDANGRLLSERFTNDSGATTQNNIYTYDERGNRLTRTVNGVTTTYTYDAMNRVVSANGFAYRYDADGNLLEDEERIYTWTKDNRIASEKLKSTGQVWTYGYDALGNRISVTTGGSTTLWTVDPDGNVLAEYVDGVQTRSYYHGLSLAGFSTSNGQYFFNADMLGSTLSVTDGAGQTVNAYTYDAFGNVLASVEGVANDFEFVGGYGLIANASGTTYVRARNYDADTGRWISADPIGIAGGENLYEYCGGNPVTYIDEDGNYSILTPASVGDIAFKGAEAFAKKTKTVKNATKLYEKGLNASQKGFIKRNGSLDNYNGYNPRPGSRYDRALKTSKIPEKIKFYGNLLTVGTSVWDIGSGIWNGGLEEGARRAYTNAGTIFGGLAGAALFGLPGAVIGGWIGGWGAEWIANNLLLPPDQSSDYYGRPQLTSGNTSGESFWTANSPGSDYFVVIDASTGGFLECRQLTEVGRHPVTYTLGYYLPSVGSVVASCLAQNYDLASDPENRTIRVRYGIVPSRHLPYLSDIDYQVTYPHLNSASFSYDFVFGDHNTPDDDNPDGDPCEIPDVLADLSETNAPAAGSVSPSTLRSGASVHALGAGGREKNSPSLGLWLNRGGLSNHDDYEYSDSLRPEELCDLNAAGSPIVMNLLDDCPVATSGVVLTRKRISAVAVDNVFMNLDGTVTVYYTDPRDGVSRLCHLTVDATGAGTDASGRTVDGFVVIDGEAWKKWAASSAVNTLGAFTYSGNTVFGSGALEGGYVLKGATVGLGSISISGRHDIKGSISVSSAPTFAENTVFNFDLSRDVPGETAKVDNIRFLSGANLEITVDKYQTPGDYVIASDASGFLDYFTLTGTSQIGYLPEEAAQYGYVSANFGTSDLGTIAAGETVRAGDGIYALRVSNDNALVLTVGNLAFNGGVVTRAAAGDLNGDGRADVIMSITQSTHPHCGATGAWLIQDTQTAAWGDLSQRNAGWEIFGTGLTAAGKTTNDVYLKNTGNVVGAWVTDATGKVAGWETVGSFDANTQVLGLGDFNGDGQTDLLLRNVNGAVGCYLTSGDVTGWNYFQSLGDEWKICAIGDLNGDGRSDVALKHDAGFAGSWLTQSDCTMAWANLDTLASGFEIAGCGDFNGDGTSDVLLKKDTYYGAWLVENGSAAGWMGLGDLGRVTVEQIADFDADGIDDLRIRTSAGDLGTQLVKAADNLNWKYYGSVGPEWSTRLAAV